MAATTPSTASRLPRPLFLGIDVGGTNIKLGVVDDAGRVVGKTHLETEEERGPADAVVRTRKAAEELVASLKLKTTELAAVGLATPGTQDLKAGTLLHPHNLPHWFDFPIRQAVADAFSLPVGYANDANAAAYGEFWVGSGREFHGIVLLTLGTGVGGGIIIGDLNVEGEHSHGSECGHIIVDNSPQARMCGCGQPGHLEAYCSATALIQRAQEELDRESATTLRSRVRAGEELSGLMIAEEAEKGDALAAGLIEELATWLGLGIVTLMHCVDPGAVILGGAMNFGRQDTPLGRKFLERVRSIVKARAFPTLAEKTVIDFAALGGDAGFIGAAGIGRLQHQRQ
ncbi:MAG TPA: ROK family protein [Pirellulaceae bacterium]|nr:ROK family protein [Pirellulaceae bacterium]